MYRKFYSVVCLKMLIFYFSLYGYHNISISHIRLTNVSIAIFKYVKFILKSNFDLFSVNLGRYRLHKQTKKKLTVIFFSQLPKRTFQRRTRPPVVQPEVDIEKVQRGDSKYTKRNETRPATTAAPRRNERPPNRFVRRKPGGANGKSLRIQIIVV